MGSVSLNIGGRPHVIACRDGEEPRLQALGRLMDQHAQTARPAAGGNPERLMLLAALLLADQMDEERRAAPASPDELLLDDIAIRLESLADALEEPLPGA